VRPLTKNLRNTNAMSNALLIGLAMTVAFGCCGYVLKILIWNKSVNPTSPIDWGRKFASYLIFISTLTGGNLFLKNDFYNASIKFLIVIVVFSLGAFVAGLIFGFVKRSSNKEASRDISSLSINELSGKQYQLSNRRILIIISIFVCLVAVAQIGSKISRTSSNSSGEKWIPISAKVYPSFFEQDGSPKFHWIDEASIQKKNGVTTAYIGFDLNKRGADDEIFIKSKIEADCSIPKFRKISIFRYSKGVDDNFGDLVSEETDYQKWLAQNMLKHAPNYVHNGGWVSRTEAKDDVETYASGKEHANEMMVSEAKTNLAILQMICN
jgi:hypothetical protein